MWNWDDGGFGTGCLGSYEIEKVGEVKYWMRNLKEEEYLSHQEFCCL